MKCNFKKVLFGLSVSLVLAMAIGSFALGETQSEEATNGTGLFNVTGGTEGIDYSYANSVLTIHSGNLTISTNGETDERIVVDGAATITLAGVNIDRSSEAEATAALTITDDATFDVKILLADGKTNILKGKVGSDATGDEGSPGIMKNGSGASIGTLTIGVPSGSQGTGTLEATGGYEGAGIGGGDNKHGSNITISDGVVTATGGQRAAGIGGGNDESGSNITISGGVVTATGGIQGAGIGGGNNGSGSNITITGGEVTANGENYGAGIGGGDAGSGSNITISGGVVTATGRYNGAGIGGGDNGSGNDITINGGEVTATGGTYGAGIGGGIGGSGSNITISGGEVTANGGQNGAGIGGGYTVRGSGSNITISGGVVTATGGSAGAGIGGGWYGSGSNITISDGVVTATGGQRAAGIGGGNDESGSNITISGGVVTATGGQNGAGIGGGTSGSGSGNSLNGDAVVLATSGNASKAALEGFVNDQQESLLTQGIAFTGLGTAFDSDGHATAFSWDEGIVYGVTTLLDDLEIPVTLTVPEDSSLTINQGVTLTVPVGMALQNEGTLTVNGTVDCQHDEATGTTGEVTTKTDFYREGSTDVYTTGYQTYQTSAGVQKYTNLPNPDQTFINWYYVDQDGRKTKIDENSFVALNAHSFYENLYAISIAKQGEGEITPNVTEAAKDDTVTFEATPADGYELKEESVMVTDADGNEVPVTEEDGKYTFTMPGADVEISAEFELLPTPEPSVDPGHGGDGSDASSKTGDSFAGIAALAILGLAATGAVLVCKRK